MSRAYTLACFKAFGYKFIDESMLSQTLYFRNLNELKDELKICELCNLSKTRNNILNLGSFNAKIMVIFDNPKEIQEKNEDIFALDSVKEFKDTLVQYTGVSLNDLYFTFLVKCRVPKNSSLEDEHIKKCSPYLFEEIEKVKPRVILTMGECVSKAVLREELSLDIAHGSVFRYQNSFIIPMYDLSFVLTNPSKKEFLLEDIRRIKELL